MPDNIHIKLAKEKLKRYTIKHNATFRGVFLREFDREELLKIADMYADLIKRKDKTIDCLYKDAIT